MICDLQKISKTQKEPCLKYEKLYGRPAVVHKHYGDEFGTIKTKRHPFKRL